jgi:NADP-dependent 3-hydroxy acid dehydrogenase YdfG
MQGKVIVITGASGGIGSAFARHASALKARVVLVARRSEELEWVRALCGADAIAITADVTRRADVERIVSETLARFGQIDVWVNNVGQGISRNPSELTDEDIDAVMLVNVKSALYGTQSVLPHFKSRGRGHVINISSMLGRTPFAVIRSAYCGAKHFLNALTATFRAEVQSEYPDIQFSLVSPGVVRTDFGLNAIHGGPDSRSFPGSQSAEEVAEVIADVVQTRQPDVYTRPGAKAAVHDYLDKLTSDPQVKS